MTVMNRKDRRSWDQMVRAAREVYAEVPLGEDEDPIKVYVPDADTLAAFFTRRQTGSLAEALGVLMGEDNVARLETVAKRVAGEDARVPVTVWREILEQVMDDLGMGQASPER